MQQFLEKITSIVPSELDLLAIGKFVLIVAVTVFVLGFLFRKLVGKNSLFNRSLCAGIGILFIYAVTIVVYTFNPAGLSRFLAPLPYTIFSGDKLYLFVFNGTRLDVISFQILTMLILSWLYHIMDDFLPRGKGGHWLLYRVLTILMSMALHFVAVWAINRFLTGPLLSYAPTVLVVILAFFFLLPALKLLLGVVLTIANPIIGAVYGFFFSNKVGKQLTKALLTTLMLSVVVILLQYFGYGVISVSSGALIGYIPLVFLLLALWFGFSHLF